MGNLLFSNARTALLGGSIVALLAVWVLWGQVPEPWLLVWGGAVIAINAVRYLHVVGVRRSGSVPRSALTTYTAGTLASGIVWGMAGLWFFSSVSFQHQVFLAFLLGGMAAGAVAGYGAWRPAFYAFLVPALLPIILRFLSAGDETALTMGVVLAVYGVALLMLGRNINKALGDALTPRDELDGSETRFKDFSGAALDWYWETDENLRFTLITDTVQRYNGGIDPSVFYGMTRRELPIAHNKDKERWERHFELMDAREPFQNFEYSFVDRHGEIHDWSISGWPIFDGEGSFVGYRGVGRDTTEASQLGRMKNEFVSTVSHELRSPLTSITGALDLIKGGALGRIPDDMEPMVDVAYKNSERLFRLINDLLDIEKIEAGSMAFDMKTIDVMPLVEQAVEENRGIGEQYGVSFLIEADGPGAGDPDVVTPRASVVGDADRLIQVLNNLLSNAAKFSEAGAPVRVGVARQNGSVTISVANRGRPIPADFGERIFDKFSQVDASDTKTIGGTGLGLSIAKAIVEKHEGRIGFESSENETTTFRVSLPAA